MIERSEPYDGRVVVFATQHGKEKLATSAFLELGASVIAPSHVDTDQFGTFTGEIPRALRPRAAALAKARLAISVTGIPLALASEGSFTTNFGGVVQHRELLIFVDNELGCELEEHAVRFSPLPAGRAVDDLDAVLRYASEAGFPAQRLVLRGGLTDSHIVKGIGDPSRLIDRATLLLHGPYPVTIEPDLRAHFCPSRAEIIRVLVQRMARRLATRCPQCGSPGFGRTGSSGSLPCRDCGEGTSISAADVLGCAMCAHFVLEPVRDRWADPQWCDGCNP